MNRDHGMVKDWVGRRPVHGQIGCGEIYGEDPGPI